VADYYLVTNARGPAWDYSRPRRKQDGWDEHAAFMDELVATGFIELGGPVGDGRRVLHVIRAYGEEEVRARLAQDPWAGEMLVVASVEPWEVLLDGRRLV
jgi:hypothetical protein